jgi:hypothetical protein
MKDRGIQLADNSDSLQGMDLKIDVVRDASGKITQGLVIGNTMNQNQAMIIVANPGEFKFSPTLGVAIDELLLDGDYLRMRHRIREHLEKDGMKVRSIDFSEGQPLVIDASYE